MQELKQKNTTILKNDSYLFSISNDVDSSYQDSQKVFKNILFYQKPSKNPGNTFRIENDDFLLILEGYFYLNLSDTADPKSNLKMFLSLLSQYSFQQSCRKINGGMFNLFVIDKEQGVLNIINDRMGLIPLFYLQNGSQILISNNQFNFAEQTRLSESALFEFLKFGYLPVAPSLFERVERLHPAESLQVTLDTLLLSKTREIPADYPVVQKRLSHVNKTADQWAVSFARFFSRFRKTGTMLGLSGGYDSRLNAAYMKEENPLTLNFGHPDSGETKLAKEVAATYSLKFENEQFPDNSFARYAAKINNKFRTIVSLENVHVMHLSNRINEARPQVYLDGFLGGAIFGDAYFGKKEKSISGLLDFLFARNSYNNQKLSSQDYVNHFYHKDKEALADEELNTVFTGEQADQIRARFRAVVSNYEKGCVSHEDVLERVSMFTRGRNLIGAGPVTISAHTQTALPFTDYSIFQLAQNTSKRLRAAHFLYNHLWRNYFPEMAAIRKAGNFGRALDSAFIYRLKSVAFIFFKNYLQPLRDKFSAQGSGKEEHYFSNEMYLKNSENRQYIERLMNLGNRHIPRKVHSVFLKKYQNQTISNSLLIRYISILSYLEGTE